MTGDNVPNKSISGPEASRYTIKIRIYVFLIIFETALLTFWTIKILTTSGIELAVAIFFTGVCTIGLGYLIKGYIEETRNKTHMERRE